MNTPNYTHTFTVQRTAREVYDAICDVTGWWTIHTDGATKAVGDEFTVHFGDVHITTQRITEAVPEKRITWRVTKSYLPWLKDREEWKGTDIVFEITEGAEGTRLTMTHIGLTPHVECFTQCEKGWDFFMGSLNKLITTGEGQPDTRERTHLDLIGHVHPTNA